MSYSCTTAAMDALDRLMELQERDTPSTNVWRFNGVRYFHEIGRENEDGAVTGSVWAMDGRRVGSFRIEPSGRIARFPFTAKPRA